MASTHRDVNAALGRLAAQLQAQAAEPSPPRPGPGRPDTGIRSGYARVEAYIPADVRDALDRLADRRETQTGQSTHRADVIREALIMYLRHADHQET